MEVGEGWERVPTPQFFLEAGGGEELEKKGK